MDGQSFITINPDTLADSTLWSYRDLQKISKALGLKANGQRDLIVERLQSWNRLRLDGGTTIVEDRHHMKLTSKSIPNATENLEMNVEGFNFSILAIHVKEKSISTHCLSSSSSHRLVSIDDGVNTKKFAKAKRSHQSKKRKQSRRSIIGFLNKDDGKSSKQDMPGTISPSFLRPLRAEPATPGKSCLKQVSRYTSVSYSHHPNQDTQQQQSRSRSKSPTSNKPVVRSPLADLDVNSIKNNSNSNTIMSSSNKPFQQPHYNSIDTGISVQLLSPTRIRDITLNNTNNNTLLASPAKTLHLPHLAVISQSPLRTTTTAHAAILASAVRNNNSSKSSNLVVVPASATKRLPNICFSPFNGVRIIAHREGDVVG